MPMDVLYHDSKFLHYDQLDGTSPSSDYILVILNYKMPLLTLPLWKRAHLRICADGGANQLYDYIPKFFPCDDPAQLRAQYRPDTIKGDLDSLRPEVRKFYEDSGTIIVDESHDQDTTDLHKCISYIVEDRSVNFDLKNMKILVLGAMGGRLDHEFGNLNVLYSFSTLNIILLNDECMTFLLVKDVIHKIQIEYTFEGPHCGLIPLGASSASTTTTGLKWNLEGSSMQFGGLISVCNQVQDKVVTVLSDSNLIWTITIHKERDRKCIDVTSGSENHT